MHLNHAYGSFDGDEASNDDRDALDLDFNQYVAPMRMELVNFARRLTQGAVHRAEDIVQDSMIRALRGWSTFVPETDDVVQCVRNFLYKIVRNTFLNLLKNEKNRPDRESFLFDGIYDHHAAPDPRETQDAGASDEVLAAIASLEPKWRQVIEPYYFQELNTEEIAELLGIPRCTVKTRLRRARLLLEKALQEYATDEGYGRAPYTRSDRSRKVALEATEDLQPDPHAVESVVRRDDRCDLGGLQATA